MKILTTALDNTPDGAMIIDDQQKIIYVNEPAQRLLRIDLEQDSNLRCYSVVRGLDSDRRPVCRPACSVLTRCKQGYAVPASVIQVEKPGGGFKWLTMRVLNFVDERHGRVCMVHLFREAFTMDNAGKNIGEIERARQNHRSSRAITWQDDEPLRRFAELTERERQVLSHLVRGQGTREIADTLSITINTTRNHIQHILQKLDVHSRAAAVAYVARHDLLTRWRQTRWW